VILAELELEDFKQFAGTHHFEPSAEGVIGIIGANGVGKTTLFEAIEWCLYQPRSITSEEVFPRGKAGKPRVKLVLQDLENDIRYVVERTLRKSGANAEIYREDQPETRIVQGPRQVTEYVSRHLVGLGHRAFVSTFFTRQKELSFFGSLTGTERRREVGRLLGFETIREAQRQIGEERAKAAAEAKVVRAQYEEQRAGRDFEAESRAADEAVTVRTEELTAADDTLATASANLMTAREMLSQLREVERRDAEVRRQLERVAGDRRTAEAQRNAAARALAELDQAAQRRAELAPIAAEEANRAAVAAAFDAERDRFTQQRHYQADLARLDQADRKTEADLRQSVTRANAPAVSGWAWTKQDSADLVAAAGRLIGIAEGVDASSAVTYAAALAACHELVRARDKAFQEFKKYEQHLSKLRAQRDALVAAGDPGEEAATAQTAREGALARAQAATSNAENYRRIRDEIVPIVESLESRTFEGACPTCGRPFSAHEAGITLAALRDRVDTLNADIKKMQHQRKAAEQAAATSADAYKAAIKRQKEVAELSGRVAQGEPMVETAERTFDDAVTACHQALADHGLPEEPTTAHVEAAQQHARMLQRVGEAVPMLQRLHDMALDQRQERETVTAALADLGTVEYDANAHTAADQALREAQAAAAQIGQIDRDLERRPRHEHERRAAETDLERLSAEQCDLEAHRAKIGFDQTALDSATQVEQDALGAERGALDARNVAQSALKEAISSRTALLADQERIAGLLDRADTRQRQADIFEQMYREFTLFDQYVAGRITPQLAEQTSELLEQVTEGKYDHVTFDENYGLLVYDGADEKFPMEEFSGGERDVIALCARLALSRMIGSQAANPPSFLVLDEVFGSLDRERRNLVLDTLGRLAGTAEAFQQLFIISHVEDVRSSPIFSEVWRVTETSEGISHLENLNLTGGVEEA
jgi:exonuclease SbcC